MATNTTTLPYGYYPNCILKVDCILRIDEGDLVGYIDYYPNLAGNIFMAAFFGVVLALQLIQCFWYRTWSFSVAMILGLILEILGYGGRIGLSENPFKFDYFLLYLICLTIAPVFFTAAIYLSLARLIPLHDPSRTLSRLSPKTYTYLFITADFISLVLQAAGGGLSATANTQADGWTGVHTMIAGLAFQVFSLLAFSVLCAEFAWKVYRAKRSGNTTSSSSVAREEALEGLKCVGWFEIALVAATLFILVRSVFRCAELKDGFAGELANEEIPFMILESAMVGLGVVCLTVLPPGWVLPGVWGRKKGTRGGKGGYVESSSEEGVELR